jgi:hypothetical protein
MSKIDWNHIAYEDVANCDQPQYPDNEEYMKAFRSWRPLQKYPEDMYENDGDYI